MMQHQRRRPATTASRPGSTSSAAASSAWPPASPSSTSPSTTPPAASARSGDRRGLQDRPGDQHHRRHVGRLRDDGRHGHHDRHRPAGQQLARRSLRRSAGSVGGVFGTAVATMGMLMTTRLHPGHGHLRPHHRQRRRHRRVQPRREGRPRDHRPPRRGRQHHQGADQGLRHRVRRPGRLPALLGLHRQGQPDPQRQIAPARGPSQAS